MEQVFIGVGMAICVIKGDKKGYWLLFPILSHYLLDLFLSFKAESTYDFWIIHPITLIGFPFIQICAYKLWKGSRQ